jgi:hypothetical protein
MEYWCEILLASTDVTLWRQLVVPHLDFSSFLHRPLSQVLVGHLKQMIILFCSCVMFSSFSSLRVFFSVHLTFSGFSLTSLLSLWLSTSCRCFPIFDGLLLISSKYIRDPRLDITWSSYGRPLLWDSRLRVDIDLLDASFSLRRSRRLEPFDTSPSESLTDMIVVYNLSSS